jgi:predicted nucleotidyltransferase/DNA-binding XRE family transcriptional regulator
MTGPSAAELLREARRRAGLSQVELGRRAGIAQSVVSAYESGRRQPALTTLAALVRATGHDLDVRVIGAPLPGPVGRRLTRHRAEIVRTAEAHRVGNVRVFGSVARGDDRPDSDVDLLVDVPAGVGLLALARLQAALEDLLDAPVDLVPADGLRPQVQEAVLGEAVAL